VAEAGTAVRSESPPLSRYALVGLLAWLVPGLGHIYAGQRKRGWILLITIAATFWSGVAVGGVQSTVLPKMPPDPITKRAPRDRQTWFVAQMFCGVHTLATLGLGEWRTARVGVHRADFTAEDLAIIYTGVAGLLNLLVILDAVAACDPNYVRLGSRPPPRRGADE
jgi:hypothetical protein